MPFPAAQNWIKRLLKNLLALFIGLALAFLLLEIFLRIWDPFHFSVLGNKIVLLSNYKRVFHPQIPKAEEYVQYSRNQLGFRGAELPADFQKRLSIITVGGSTTECRLLSDSITWTELLQKKLRSVYLTVWMNNAGFDGHTTMGHIILLKDHLLKLKPAYIIFLTGINDVELNDYRGMEKQMMKAVDQRSFLYFILTICNYSKAASLMVNLYRSHLASNRGFGYCQNNLTARPKNIPMEERLKRLNAQDKYLQAYRMRLDTLVSLCRLNNITPILLTQPYLGGECYDQVSGRYLGNLATGAYNTGSEAEVLNRYNDVVRTFKSKGVRVIDLANELPKNAELYFDFIHFTAKGSEEVAEVLFRDLKGTLNDGDHRASRP